jgi:CRISPR/Cas system CSM-associated protein Csm3 (group 7 of RAMP superfamily)
MSNERLKRNQRHIIERILIRGTLILDTPTCLGSGDADGPTDMMLVRDSISLHALLTGASIAGALRNYVHEREDGYGKEEQNNSVSASLFGGISKDDDGDQSRLIINDSISSEVPKTEIRDGVKINSVTHTAEDKAKYDLEFLAAGTEFPLCFELLIEKEKNKTEEQFVQYKRQLIEALAIALQGLEPKKDSNDSECENDSKSGEISLGMKKRRGFGRCHVKEWQVWNFNLEDVGDRNLWLNFEHWRTGFIPIFNVRTSITEALGIELDIKREDKRDRFLLHATFKLVGSLLIRSGQDSTERAPDVVHLKSHRPDKPNPESVLSGTSLAGVLRHRAERIVNTLNEINPQITQEIVNEIFGFVKDKKELKHQESNENKKKPDAKASRLVVHEKVIEKATDLVQTRIAIDRFTGGAYHGALFDEQPIFGGYKTRVCIELELRNPKDYEIGLLLLLLKDLWTQDLPVGGESSIGRGRLQGKEATLTWYQWDEEKELQHQDTWTIAQASEKQPLVVSDSDRLKKFVQELVNYPTEVVNANE